MRRELSIAAMGAFLGPDGRTCTPRTSRLPAAEVAGLVVSDHPVVSYLPDGRLVRGLTRPA